MALQRFIVVVVPCERCCSGFLWQRWRRPEYWNDCFVQARSSYALLLFPRCVDDQATHLIMAQRY